MILYYARFFSYDFDTKISKINVKLSAKSQFMVQRNFRT